MLQRYQNRFKIKIYYNIKIIDYCPPLIWNYFDLNDIFTWYIICSYLPFTLYLLIEANIRLGGDFRMVFINNYSTGTVNYIIIITARCHKN